MSNRIVAFVLLLVANGVQVAIAGDVEIRLIAADRKNKPLVSDIVSFRRSPDGGLIAVQWVSGIHINDKPLFQVKSDESGVPKDPSLAGANNPATDDLDDLLKEIKGGKKDKVKPRPVDLIDPQYRDGELSGGLKIGPVRRRRSSAVVPVSRPQVANPGGIALTGRVKRVDVPCYPVTLTAVIEGLDRRQSFVPTLSSAGRDLLADCLFEHSPDLPTGDVSRLAQGSDTGRLGWLKATRGGRRSFFRLTIYLPITPAGKPYKFAGRDFHLSKDGIELVEQTASTERELVRKFGPFHLEMIRRVETQPVIQIPLMFDPEDHWRTAQTQLDVDLLQKRIVSPIRIDSAVSGQRELRPQLPTGLEFNQKSSPHLHGVLIGDEQRPVVRLIAIPQSADTVGKTLTIRMAQTDGSQKSVLSATFDGSLRTSAKSGRPVSSVSGQSSGSNKGTTRYAIRFERHGPETWTAQIDGIPAGMYGLTLGIKPVSHISLPIVIAGSQLAASTSLLTYHNRNDWLRGETVHLGIVTRAIRELRRFSATIRLAHESGETVSAGTVSLSCPSDETRSLFFPIDTAKLRLGEYRVTLEPGDSVRKSIMSFGTSFTVHSANPKSTFALYSWFSNSFSGPIKVGDKPLVNITLSQKPTAALTPDELSRYTRQPVFPANLHSIFERDPLYPVPETTVGYDAETEQEIAVAMRLGMRYCPDYGWGMNGQESAWNPKHTLPAELDRIGRLCSQVTQRHRDFGNFGGLHFNWYPRLGGNWEQHPPTDGHAIPRRKLLQQETAKVYAETAEDRKSPTSGVDRAVRAHKHRVGAFARAYDAWTERARKWSPGLGLQQRIPNRELQPGIDKPVYTSFPPVSWFQQRNYYPSAFHSKLPVTAVHAYTDFGFSPFQPLWAIDHWAAGVGEKPVWATTMSNGRDIMLRHALLMAGRGADGIDIKGQDDRTAAAISDFLMSYGPYFRTLQPHSDVAIITSLRQQVGADSKKLIGQWMGYTGGSYFDLYGKLWYARRPAAMLPEEDVTDESLRKYQAVFLVGQSVPFPPAQMKALKKYVAEGGRVFKDAGCTLDFPGKPFQLVSKTTNEQAKRWHPERYRETRDRFFVGTQAGYESVANSLEKVLSELPPPRVTTPSHNVLLATLRPSPGNSRNAKESSNESTNPAASVVFAVNDTHPFPGIQHPWNFWSASIMATRSQLTFERPCFVYDLLEGGVQRHTQPSDDGKHVLPVSFDRCAGRAYIVTDAPIQSVQVTTATVTSGGRIPVAAQVVDDRGRPFSGTMPCQVEMVDNRGQVVQTIFRALGGDRKTHLTIPAQASAGQWKIRVRELVSGRTAVASVEKLKPELLSAKKRETAKTIHPTDNDVLMTRPKEVAEFFTESRSKKKGVLILLDQQQIARYGEAILELTQGLADKFNQQGRSASVKVVTADEVIELPLRWRPTARDSQYIQEAREGERIIAAASLATKHFAGANGGSGKLDALHPESGWLEPGARHRVYRDVVLLGDMQRNRFIADLHKTVGMRGSRNFPATGSAMVQVVHDAFVPKYDCLSIQAPDLAGLQAGIAAVSDATANQKIPFESPEVARPRVELRTVTSDDPSQLPNPIRDTFGVEVHPLAFATDGGLLASAGTQGANYFEFSGEGKLKRKWLGKYAIEAPRGSTTDGLWIRQWWGVPGFVNTIVRADESLSPQWLMQSPPYSRSFAGWKFPGRSAIADVETSDLFVAGHHQLSRITPSGKVVWRYDDLSTSQDVESFRFARNFMLYGVSPDRRYLLTAAFGIEPYANFVSRFVRPAVILFDTQDGKIVWEKPGVLIDHSACGFVAWDRIVVADATPSRKRVMLLDISGKEVWSHDRPQGTSAAVLSPDGEWLIVRPEAPRGANFQTLGQPVGLQSIRVSPKSKNVENGRNATDVEFSLTAAIHSWRVTKSDGRVLVSTIDGRLRCFRPDATLIWERDVNGPSRLLDSPDGTQIAVGTQNGLLLWLDNDGEVTRQIDLMPHNIVTDVDRYVRDYTAKPDNIPVLNPLPAAPPRIDERCKSVVTFSKNLFETRSVSRKVPNLSSPQRVTKTTPLSWKLSAAAPGTYVISLSQRIHQSVGGEKLILTVTSDSEKAPLLTAPLLPSAAWEERTASWRLLNKSSLTITLSCQGEQTGIEVREPALFTVRYPSRNLFAQKVLNSPDIKLTDEPSNDLEDLLGDGGKIEPPTVGFFLPNDLDLAARSRGAPPFLATVPFTQPFDGILSSQSTSWLKRPLNASSHAQLRLRFKKPTKLSALAVYEDSSAGYTETYAIFCRDQKTQRWKQVGRVTDNNNQYNLFTFPTMETSEIIYLWLKSADKHARIAELEGYRKADLLAP